MSELQGHVIVFIQSSSVISLKSGVTIKGTLDLEKVGARASISGAVRNDMLAARFLEEKSG